MSRPGSRAGGRPRLTRGGLYPPPRRLLHTTSGRGQAWVRKLPYLLFYLVCGYVAAYGFAFANQTSLEPLIGASGAIAGVLGAYLVIYPRAKVWSLLPFLFFIPVRIPAWLVLGSWFVLQWVYSAGYAASGAGDVAYLAHIFGFLAGVVIGLFVRAASAPTQYPVHPRYR